MSGSGRAVTAGRPIRVARIYTSLDVGGIAVRLLDVIPRLNPDLFEVHMIYIKRAGSLDDSFRARKVPLHACRCHGRLPFPPSTRRLAALLTHLGIQIAHAHTVIPALFATAAARRARVPIIVANYHNIDSIPLARQIWLERRQSRHRDVAIHVSASVRDDYLLRVRPMKTDGAVIYNGVDIEHFSRAPEEERRNRLVQELGLEGRGPIVLSVARLHRNKAPLDMLRAFSTVLARHPRAILIMAGGGPERALVEVESRRLGAAASVRVLRDRDDVRDLYHLADVQALASVKEGFCNVILEAMAAGLPQVLTDLPGNREAVAASRAALLSPPRRPDLLAANLLAVLESASTADEMGKAARLQVRRFTVERQVRETEEIYLSLARRHGLVTPLSSRIDPGGAHLQDDREPMRQLM